YRNISISEIQFTQDNNPCRFRMSLEDRREEIASNTSSDNNLYGHNVLFLVLYFRINLLIKLISQRLNLSFSALCDIFTQPVLLKFLNLVISVFARCAD